MNITKNRVISIDYILRDVENHIIDSTSDADPLTYLHGHENIIPGLEKALEGKSEGDHFTITIPAAEAYGERDEELVIQVPLDRFEDAEAVATGMQFEAETADGSRVVTVTNVTGTHATIDGNHPLAGMALTFDVTVTGIREAEPEEIDHGHPHHACGDCDACEDDACGCGE
ncbi:MAG: peptidylprolyl isomerase [Treponema sp.]|jgi:FKBP-type peptidyl-prolyl cis-trans isomerase SlyD|nr:peptidylprolyl isomerase [Treponema sp.]